MSLFSVALIWSAFALQAPSTPAASATAIPAYQASYLRAEDYRVSRIGFRLGLAGARYCPAPYPLTGLLLHHLLEYEAKDHATLRRERGLERGPGILAVIEDSPAARAGLAAGDVLLAINGRPFPTPTTTAEGGTREVRLAIEESERELENQLRQGPARLAVLREGREQTVPLGSSPGCPARVRLARSRQMNAFANRGYAVMTTRLLEFTLNDDEVAIILAHEIAHNILGHPEQLQAQGIPNGILLAFGANAARIRATEEEADRLGLKLAWAAGYDVSAAIPFWRRFSAKRGPRIRTTHPGLRERERIINETLATLGASQPAPQAPQLREGPLPQR